MEWCGAPGLPKVVVRFVSCLVSGRVSHSRSKQRIALYRRPGAWLTTATWGPSYALRTHPNAPRLKRPRVFRGICGETSVRYLDCLGQIMNQ